MIRHIVLVRFSPDLRPGEETGILSSLADLCHVVPGVRGFTAGANVSPEHLAKGFTHAFTFDFDDEAARDAYLVHPAHQAAGSRLVEAAQGGTEGLIVLDIAV